MFEELTDEILLPIDRIVQDPAVMVGKPVVKGTRIPVELVLEHLADNPELDELFAAFPRLTVDDVKAVLAYARQAVITVDRQTRARVAVAATSSVE
jgi:uncharacterized protein (DUF433 family)